MKLTKPMITGILTAVIIVAVTLLVLGTLPMKNTIDGSTLTTSFMLGTKSSIDIMGVELLEVPDEAKHNLIRTNGVYRTMKRIEVVAAVIRRGPVIFATQRGYGEFKDWWEFPGGKIEPGETPQQALVREIREELYADITVGDLIQTVEWDYPAFHLTMHCFWCEFKSEALHLNEHEASAWLNKESLHSVKWLPADEGILSHIEESLG